MSAGPLAIVTVGVSSIDDSLALFRDVLGLTVEHDVADPPGLAEAWGLGDRRVRVVELSHGRHPVGRLRLAEFDPPATQRVRDDHGGDDGPTDVGPKALDFYVHHGMATAVEEVRGAGYAPRSRPIRYEIGEWESEELLLSGPDGVPFLLMVGHRHSPLSLRAQPPGARYSEIATQSVVAGDLGATRRFYGELFGLHGGTDAEVGDEHRTLADELTGVPLGTRIHFLVYSDPPEPSGKYLLVHFFDATGKRLRGRMQPGNLGVSLFTHTVGDLDALLPQVPAAGGAVVGEPREVTLGDKVWRVALVRGPNEELFELRQHREG